MTNNSRISFENKEEQNTNRSDNNTLLWNCKYVMEINGGTLQDKIHQNNGSHHQKGIDQNNDPSRQITLIQEAQFIIAGIELSKNLFCFLHVEGIGVCKYTYYLYEFLNNILNA
jgi:hypothetical protein